MKTNLTPRIPIQTDFGYITINDELGQRGHNAIFGHVLTNPYQIVKILRRIVLMLLCIGVGSYFAQAQKSIDKSKNADVFMSKKSNRKRGQTINKFTKVEDDKYEIELTSKDEYEYVTYDSELNVVDTRTEKKPEPKKAKDYGKADWMKFYFGDRRYLLLGTTERDKKQNVFTIREIDEESEEVSQPEELGQLNGEDYYFIIENADLDYWISDDESKLLISYKLPEKRDNDRVKYRRYRYMVFDRDLNLLWEKEVDFKHKNGRVSYGGNARISNDGHIFCYGTVDRGRGFKKDERFGVNLYHISEDDVQSTRINGVELSGVTADIVNGEYTIFCTYGVRGFTFLWFGNPGGEIGFLSLRWGGDEDESPKVVKTPFGADHVSKNQPTKERKKWASREKKGKSVYVPRLVIDEVILQEDGSYLVLAQEQFIVVTTYKSGRTSTKYYNLDIHVFGLNSDFGISWSSIIPCYQIMGTTVHSGYVYKQIGNKLYFVFNDNYRNLEKEWNTTKKPNRFSGGEHPTSMVVVDMDAPDEKQRRELLWKEKTVGGSFRPELYHSPDDKNFGLVYIQGGKLKQSLLRIDFKAED
ncbi:MAG: hypothetical protein KDB98_01185 [Flavobacteriales bacterium]|nr:hypothetical protein [Flavobacteriales bacterium]